MTGATDVIYLCGGDLRPGKRGDCPDDLHDFPLPSGYTDAAEEAASRLARGWVQRRCPQCRLYGWIPGRSAGKPCDERVPAGNAEDLSEDGEQ